MQMDVNKMLYCFYIPVKMPRESIPSIRIYFEFFFKVELYTSLPQAHKGVLSVFRYSFCWSDA